jgi:uncharacterized membrane protein YsdA (DUF1294 family)
VALPDVPWPWVLAAYGVAGAVAFAAYGWDKRRAERGGRRVPERTLHLLALVGGFPGAWLGRRAFRHKTRRPAFLVVIVLAGCLHAGLWALLLGR